MRETQPGVYLHLPPLEVNDVPSMQCIANLQWGHNIRHTMCNLNTKSFCNTGTDPTIESRELRVQWYKILIVLLDYKSLSSPVFGCIEDPGEVFVTVEDEGSFASPGHQGDPLPGIQMVEQDPLKLTPISRRFSEESGYQSKSENAAEYE